MGKNIIITEQQMDKLAQIILNQIFGRLYGSNVDMPSTNLENVTDKDFYSKILKQLNAPVTDENLKFLVAWRQSEGKAGKYNPFNTTQKMPGATNFNTVGVKNYQTLQDGIDATVKTLTNGRYGCIVNGLKNDIGAKNISTNCINDLRTWGTGDLIAKVITGYEKGATPKPSSITA
jgi:hypothetical protein